MDPTSSTRLPDKSMDFRVDKIDLKRMDLHLSKVWSRNFEGQKKPREVWEIDPTKLEIRQLVAHGTYRGTYDGQDVAVKLLDGEDDIKTAVKIRAFSVWHKLNHPNITNFVGASMGASHLRIPESKEGCANVVVIEYLPEGTLKNYLFENRKKKLSFKVVISLAVDLARGLSYLHAQRIVHRDVKVENMLIGPQRKLKIAGFGVARLEAKDPSEMTVRTGTLGYMAPEVLNAMPYNRKCDVYSFGICLWEIYCCDLAYTDISIADMITTIVKQNLRPHIPRCCPSSLASLMKRCWDANPNKRPEMEEVVRLLESMDTNRGGGMIPEDKSLGCLCFAPTTGP
ncbi:serine/threonine-protein kinase STY13-like [Salvia divinorum]|uniref:Serine/threonine-protein kinase STY13-like n=1 Tax=Salvia divinorum TaxID=28513 RepID=A0ABD1G7B5_SALDI